VDASKSVDAGPLPHCTPYALRDRHTLRVPKDLGKIDPPGPAWQQGEHLTGLGAKRTRAHMGPAASSKSTPHVRSRQPILTGTRQKGTRSAAYRRALGEPTPAVRILRAGK
jgi:hypothetical protein